ncbi:Rab-GTPase-TBC domain [Macleaya cordata]|uniref:Rab-GTPase-TBC domain n=1 Tax=Macleaya cordata TaxID=56857 RepID=A0A200Q2S7_MACCD|nr:Rab-GTPase-TBC domain [Macleaya cordata]
MVEERLRVVKRVDLVNYLLLVVVVVWWMIWRSSGGGSGVGGGGGGFWMMIMIMVEEPFTNVIRVEAISVSAMAGLCLGRHHRLLSASLKSPWSRRRRKHALSSRQWKNLFTPDGKIRDRVKFLKKVRSGGVDPSIRADVWPFLLGVYDLNTTQEERDSIKTQNRKKYENLRRQCRRLVKRNSESFKLKETNRCCSNEEVMDSPGSEDVVSARESLSSEGQSLEDEDSDRALHNLTPYGPNSLVDIDDDQSGITNADASTESSDSDSSAEEAESQVFLAIEGTEENDPNSTPKQDSSPSTTECGSNTYTAEDFATWQRIIRVDAVRANADWVVFSPNQAAVSEGRARRSAEAVKLKDYDHLEPCRIFHAARLVAILEAYALYDTEIGYCQGMSDLLSPIIAVIEEDHEAFWCFVGFMRKARHNFRLDEVGIRRQLNIVSKIIKSKDSHLYRHLEKLQAEDCFFVYRMVVVLFRRELTFEQTVCIWEVMWADQSAIRAGIGKSAWGRIRQRAPPTDDLLLYAIAACVLQRRKLIIEKYSSMDEIIRECNSMAGQLDVWKLLDDAHDLVVTLHDKIQEDQSAASSG